ncbi:hypothetical protein COO60DRAFT_323447 [Scenedesmus sp. NREL 46B-D3]|nr:hypothetical protein COO60DRAFT_323447 [Scenedesmus sp. NREL 46B-D3]
MSRRPKARLHGGDGCLAYAVSSISCLMIVSSSAHQLPVQTAVRVRVTARAAALMRVAQGSSALSRSTATRHLKELTDHWAGSASRSLQPHTAAAWRPHTHAHTAASECNTCCSNSAAEPINQKMAASNALLQGSHAAHMCSLRCQDQHRGVRSQP